MRDRLRPAFAALLAAFALASAAAAATASSSSRPLAQRLARALAVPHVSPSRSSAFVLDLETGNLVFSRNSGLSLAPASNEKLPITYAALEELGPDYQIETDVLGQGALTGTTWSGPLFLQGHGDPTLTTAGLASLARQVRASGIRKVAGAVYGDESYFDSRRTGPGWKPGFYINESPPLSALTVDRTWFRGRHWPAPAFAAASLFRDALRRNGVAVTGGVGVSKAPSDSSTLAQVDSPPLAEIVRYMDHESDNFTAELLLKQLGAYNGFAGTSATGAAEVRQDLAANDVPLAGVRLLDGSGLSPYDRLTTRAVVGILRAAWLDETIRQPFFAALAVSGLSGTMRDRLRYPPARGAVAAKTGTTSLASALSGYVRKRYVFSVLQNGHPISYWWARRAQDRFVTVLAASS